MISCCYGVPMLCSGSAIWSSRTGGPLPSPQESDESFRIAKILDWNAAVDGYQGSLLKSQSRASRDGAQAESHSIKAQAAYRGIGENCTRK